MAASIPVQRTLEALRRAGWTASVAEKRVPIPGVVRCPACGQMKPRPGFPPSITRDLHGFVDVDAFHPQWGKLYVQSSADSGGDVAAHVAKLKSLEEVRGVRVGVLVSRAVRAGIHVEIHGWGKRGPRGKVKRWTRRRLNFTHMQPPGDVLLASLPSEEVDKAWACCLVAVEVEGEPGEPFQVKWT